MAGLPSPSVLIVLGTHNGARYLPEFTQSVRRQSCAGWKMLMRDDASTDSTVVMLRDLAAQDERLEAYNNGSRRCGAVQNFAVLLERAADLKAEYVFLADQDDVWYPEKIRKQMDRMRRAEEAAQDGTPVLVYSDLTVVDAELRTIHRSFFRRARYRQDDRRPLRTLLAHNFVPGCTMLLNRPLLELALPIPSSAPVHDWWIALCAAATGRLEYLCESTLLYRQHDDNLVGARGLWSTFNPLRASWKRRWSRGKTNFARHVEQTKALRDRLQQRQVPCHPETMGLLDGYCGLLESPAGRLRRVDGMHRLGVPKADLLRRLVFYARVLGLKR